MKITGFHLALLLASLTSAMLAGVFLAFSDVVMRSLAKADGGAQAMQIINREVFFSVFGVLLWGMLITALAIMGYALLHLNGPAKLMVVAAALLYGVGVGVVSGLFNVPMNNLLDAMAWPSTQTTAYFQASYVPDWKAWNHVRTAACITAAACYLAALLTE
ncbi:MAG: DUF1772 domain-containing protein [Acidovorax sp.]|nr:DUF1772 domain-containing protein [Acidovorax sp.]